MGQTNHDECWVSAADVPRTARRVIIWTKKPHMDKGAATISRHLDTGGAWYDQKERTWFHSDGSEAAGVTHWMEMPRKPEVR